MRQSGFVAARHMSLMVRGDPALAKAIDATAAEVSLAPPPMCCRCALSPWFGRHGHSRGKLGWQPIALRRDGSLALALGVADGTRTSGL